MTRRQGEQNPHYSHYNGLIVRPAIAANIALL
jgi:hypothetical protein